MVEYTPSVYVIASTRNGLYLDKGTEMACETPLEGDKVRVHTYSEVNSKNNRVWDSFLFIVIHLLEGRFYQNGHILLGEAHAC